MIQMKLTSWYTFKTRSQDSSEFKGLGGFFRMYIFNDIVKNLTSLFPAWTCKMIKLFARNIWPSIIACIFLWCTRPSISCMLLFPACCYKSIIVSVSTNGVTVSCFEQQKNLPNSNDKAFQNMKISESSLKKTCLIKEESLRFGSYT